MPHPETRVCLQRRELTRGYLFKKQRADPSRITVWGNCGADSPDEPSTQTLGPLTVTSSTVTNVADAGVELTLLGVDELTPGDPIQVRALELEHRTLLISPGTNELPLAAPASRTQRRVRFSVKGERCSVLAPAP